VLTGTFQSLNTVYARMSHELNLCDIAGTAWDAGFRPTTSSDPSSRIVEVPKETDIDVFAPMVLGTQSTTPVYQAASYATFASGGTYCAPIAILQVQERDGAKMKVPGSDCKQTLEPPVANTVAFAMTKVFGSTGTAWKLGGGLSDGRPVAGKTGTTNGANQSWFTGYTPNLSTSVWVGEANGDFKHQNFYVKGQFYEALYGGEIAAPTWKTYMDKAVVGLPVKTFPAPDPKLVGQPAARPKPDNNDNEEGDSNGGGSEGGGSGDTGGGGDAGNGGNSGNGNGNGNGGNNGDD
jgi:membrane peptidoglycan carboxypeptidase